MLLRHPILSLVTTAYLAVVGWLTLGPQPLDGEGRGLIHRLIRFFSGDDTTDWLTYNRVEYFANILMFIPVGMLFLLLLGRRRWWLAILLGVALTAGIEFAQTFLHDRVSDPRDLMSNSLGGLVGVIIALIATAPKARRMRRMAERARRESEQGAQPERVPTGF